MEVKKPIVDALEAFLPGSIYRDGKDKTGLLFEAGRDVAPAAAICGGMMIGNTDLLLLGGVWYFASTPILYIGNEIIRKMEEKMRECFLDYRFSNPN